MKIKFRTLERIAAELNADIRTDYSGRGMYGETCVGLVIGYSDLPALALAIQNAGAEEILPYRNAASDNLGDWVIFYWEGVDCEDAPLVSSEWI